MLSGSLPIFCGGRKGIGAGGGSRIWECRWSLQRLAAISQLPHALLQGEGASHFSAFQGFCWETLLVSFWPCLTDFLAGRTKPKPEAVLICFSSRVFVTTSLFHIICDPLCPVSLQFLNFVLLYFLVRLHEEIEVNVCVNPDFKEFVHWVIWMACILQAQYMLLLLLEVP